MQSWRLAAPVNTRAPMVASLGMYDFPWLAAATDALWTAVAAALRAAGLSAAPDRLERGRPLDVLWRDSGLLLGQTCGLPLVTSLAGRVRVVATPCHDLPGCAGPWHRAFIVVRAEDPVTTLAGLRGSRCAINGYDSNTGMNLLRATVAPLARRGRFFAAVVETAAHLESLRAVREGSADVAALDCVTHGLVARSEPALLRGTRVLGWTPAAPGLPLVTAGATSDCELALLRSVLTSAPLAPHWRSIGVHNLVPAGAEAYGVIAALAAAAAAAEYPTLS